MSEDRASPKSAQELRMAMIERQLADMEKRQKAKKIEQEEHAAFVESFLKGSLDLEERKKIRQLVLNAVADGQYEALVYSFPSDLCTDGGRAINNGESDWPKTLQGKAKEFFENFKSEAQPLGYKLKAMIINFPGGMPGDVGFFINWAPENA